MTKLLTTNRLGLALLVLGLLGRPTAAQTAPAPASAAAPIRNLAFYLAQAQQNSPLNADVKNQVRAVQLGTERLLAFYTKPTGTLVGNYTGVPVLSRDNGRTVLRYSAGNSTNYVAN